MITFETLNRRIAADHTEETFSLVAVVDSALCVGAGGSSGSLADKPILKNAENKLVIPASQLKGRLRHECEKLARGLNWPTCESPSAERMCPQRAHPSENSSSHSPFEREQYQLKKIPGYTHHPEQYHCLICQIFGNPSLPARLVFSDLVCIEPAENIQEFLRPGVTINRRRRTAEEKKLYFVETSPANAALRFEGTLTLGQHWPLAAGDSGLFAKALIVTGLRHICALGGGKSAGLGWLSWEVPEALAVPQATWAFLKAAGSHTEGDQ